MTPDLYQIILAQCPESPDLSIVQRPSPCPEHWPLIFKSLVTYRRQVQGFILSDGQNEVFCESSWPETYDKLLQLGPEAIVYVLNAQAKYSEEKKAYILRVDDVLSLKAYNEVVEARVAEEAKRKKAMEEALMEQGYLEPNSHPAEA